jgi:hypothetical protein
MSMIFLFGVVIPVGWGILYLLFKVWVIVFVSNENSTTPEHDEILAHILSIQSFQQSAAMKNRYGSNREAVRFYDNLAEEFSKTITLGRDGLYRYK